MVNGDDPNGLQVYTGYFIEPVADSGNPLALAGTLDSLLAAGGTAARPNSGWYATRPLD
jgi:hypothetical protein